MTTKDDWEFRAEYLLAQAARLDMRAAEFRTEAKALRGLAGDCQREADQHQQKQS